MEDITNEVIDQLTDSCADCGITSDIIDRDTHLFSCFPESPSYVTYRARLEGTSKTDSGSLVSLIEDWVAGGASIIVGGVLMTVDKKCSVAISSLSEGECLSPTETPTTSTVSSSSSQGFYDNATLIGGAVAVVIVLIVAIALVITVALVLKHRHGSLSIKKAE